MENLLKIMERLRAPDGCPWDRVQTHKSLRTNLVEEAYEVIDAIDSGEDSALCEELGDLLMQIAFHCVIAKEENRFDYSQVEKGICDKLVSRHSHIFGDDTAADAEEVLKLWQANKQKEKGQRTVSQAMDSVPRSFPALMESEKILKKAESAGYYKKATDEAILDIQGEVNKLKEDLQKDSHVDAEKGIGNLLLSVVLMSHLLKVDPEIALHKTVQRYKENFAVWEKESFDGTKKG